MIKNLVFTDKEHSFLVRLLTAVRDEMNLKGPNEPMTVDMKMTVPEQMDLNEIFKRLVSWK
jgi:hypothetical protein